MNVESVGLPHLQAEVIATSSTIPISVPETRGESQIRSRSKFRIALIVTALYFALFITALNATITATAIPTICADLKSASGYAWIGGAFFLGNAVSMPIWVKLSDIWGRKPIILAASGSYFVGSTVSATAKNMSTLIVGRAIQGISSGGLTQLVNITISDLFSMRRRALFLAGTEVVWAFSAAFGPVMGGIFTQLVTWRWIFWISLPISGTTFILIALFLDVHNPKTTARDGLRAIDWFGCISFLSCMLMLLLGLDFGGSVFPWQSPKVICLVIFGPIMALVFIFSEVRLARYPIIPIKLFKNKSVVGAILVATLQEYAVVSLDYYLPLFFQSAQGASPIRSGVLLLPLILTESSMGVLSGIIIHRYGRYREVIWFGAVLMALGLGLLIKVDATSSEAEIAGFQVISGLGLGFLFLPPIIALQAHVSQDDTAIATGTQGFARTLATVFAVIIGGVIFQNGMEKQAAGLRSSGLPANITDRLTGDNAAANVELVKLIPDSTQRLAAEQAFAHSLRNVWIVVTVMAVLCVFSSLLIGRQHLSTEHTETKTGIKRDQKEDVRIEDVELQEI